MGIHLSGQILWTSRRLEFKIWCDIDVSKSSLPLHLWSCQWRSKISYLQVGPVPLEGRVFESLVTNLKNCCYNKTDIFFALSRSVVVTECQSRASSGKGETLIEDNFLLNPPSIRHVEQWTSNWMTSLVFFNVLTTWNDQDSVGQWTVFNQTALVRIWTNKNLQDPEARNPIILKWLS